MSPVGGEKRVSRPSDRCLRVEREIRAERKGIKSKEAKRTEGVANRKKVQESRSKANNWSEERTIGGGKETTQRSRGREIQKLTTSTRLHDGKGKEKGGNTRL